MIIQLWSENPGSRFVLLSRETNCRGVKWKENRRAWRRAGLKKTFCKRPVRGNRRKRDWQIQITRCTREKLMGPKRQNQSIGKENRMTRLEELMEGAGLKGGAPNESSIRDGETRRQLDIENTEYNQARGQEAHPMATASHCSAPEKRYMRLWNLGGRKARVGKKPARPESEKMQLEFLMVMERVIGRKNERNEPETEKAEFYVFVSRRSESCFLLVIIALLHSPESSSSYKNLFAYTKTVWHTRHTSLLWLVGICAKWMLFVSLPILSNRGQFMFRLPTL